MEILIINKFLWPNGGAEVYIKNLCRKYEEMGHKVNYFGMADEKNTMLNKEGLYVTNSDFHSKNPLKMVSQVGRIIYSGEAKRKLKEVIKDCRPDVVHLNNFNFQLTPSILDAIPEGIPVVMTAHDSQLICPNHLMYIPAKEKTCQACLQNKTTFSCIRNRCTHGSLAKSVFSAAEGQLYRMVKTYDRIDCIVCPSQFMYDVYAKDKRFKNKLVYLQNFVNRMEAEPTEEKEDYILYFGRISPEKGIRNILKAAAATPDIEYKIIGSGDMELGDIPDNAHFLGRKEGSELYDYIRKARLVIAPSICYENNPLSVIESQQLGAAILVPSYGGAGELTSGPQIKDESSDALIEAIKEVYYDEEKLEWMRGDNLQRVKTYKDVDEYAREMVEVYEKLRKEKQTGHR